MNIPDIYNNLLPKCYASVCHFACLSNQGVRGRICAFYVVLKDREWGIFHQWSDYLKIIANFNGAMFKGCALLDEASRAHESAL